MKANGIIKGQTVKASMLRGTKTSKIEVMTKPAILSYSEDSAVFVGMLPITKNYDLFSATVVNKKIVIQHCEGWADGSLDSEDVDYIVENGYDVIETENGLKIVDGLETGENIEFRIKNCVEFNIEIICYLAGNVYMAVEDRNNFAIHVKQIGNHAVEIMEAEDIIEFGWDGSDPKTSFTRKQLNLAKINGYSVKYDKDDYCYKAEKIKTSKK